ncbi:hypothetical protein [Mesorhizobium sp.]|nr:hypothetical protein [Mesorhizobium sp.]
MQMMEAWDGRSVPRIGIGAGGAARCRDIATNRPILAQDSTVPEEINVH